MRQGSGEFPMHPILDEIEEEERDKVNPPDSVREHHVNSATDRCTMCGRRRSGMTWKQKTVVRILLLVARLVNEDTWLADEIKNLSAHINVGDWGVSVTKIATNKLNINQRCGGEFEKG